ncbi:unnamed protein product, partial [Vitis vinifera]
MASRRALLAAVVLLYLVFSSESLDFNIHGKYKIHGPIKTLVVLVMENRSFDHVLGWLKSARPEIDGLTGKESNRVFGTGDWFQNPAPMSGFAQQAKNMSEGLSKTVMSGFKPAVLPVYTALANEFAVFDRWFAAVPASTQPNRFYVHSATSHGATSNVRKDLIHGFPQRTIFDSLDENDLSFGIYYQNIPATLFFKIQIAC